MAGKEQENLTPLPPPPGEYPFTRGLFPSGYDVERGGKLWTMRMFAGFGDADDTNARFRELLAAGQTGLSVAFDMSTLYGYDTDAPEAAGEFGTCGVACSSIEDMQRIFKDIPLEKATVSMTINSPAAVIWAMFIVAAECQGVPMNQLSGTLQNDILKEFIAQKEYIFPPAPSMRLVTDTIEFATYHMPKWNTVSISGYHIREAGATPGQELAFTLADGMAYVEDCLARGMDIEAFAPRLSFFFNSSFPQGGGTFLGEIAKFRAARTIWAQTMKETYRAKHDRSLFLKFHAQTAGASLTSQDPLNNISRTTLQALAAALGGAQSIHTNSFDEALATPTAQAALVALRSQQIIAYETGLPKTVDPFGGSYEMEMLTEKITGEAKEYLARIRDMGKGSMLAGVLKGIETQFMENEIANAAYEYQQSINSGRQIIVGINGFISDHPQQSPAIQKVDVTSFRRQTERLSALRNTRDNESVKTALSQLKAVCEGTDNVMPPLIAAVRCGATLGEIMGVMRTVFGEYRLT